MATNHSLLMKSWSKSLLHWRLLNSTTAILNSKTKCGDCLESKIPWRILNRSSWNTIRIHSIFPEVILPPHKRWAHGICHWRKNYWYNKRCKVFASAFSITFRFPFSPLPHNRDDWAVVRLYRDLCTCVARRLSRSAHNERPTRRASAKGLLGSRVTRRLVWCVWKLKTFDVRLDVRDSQGARNNRRLYGASDKRRLLMCKK